MAIRVDSQVGFSFLANTSLGFWCNAVLSRGHFHCPHQGLRAPVLHERGELGPALGTRDSAQVGMRPAVVHLLWKLLHSSPLGAPSLATFMPVEALVLPPSCGNHIYSVFKQKLPETKCTAISTRTVLYSRNQILWKCIFRSPIIKANVYFWSCLHRCPLMIQELIDPQSRNHSFFLYPFGQTDYKQIR